MAEAKETLASGPGSPGSEERNGTRFDEDTYSSGATKRRGVAIARARGARLWDDQGKCYLDCSSAQGWANVGHSHPKVTEAIQAQAEILVAHTESSYNQVRAQWFRDLVGLLNERLAGNELGEFGRLHPASSGAEAVEAAIKVARILTGRAEIVALKRGFHGRTFGALSATGNPKYRDPFSPLVGGFRHIDPEDVDQLDKAVTDSTAAVLVEVIQGEGGVHPLSGEFLLEVSRRCRERGALFLVDEIQTGLGRTGAVFACEHFDLAPDGIALGKSLGGGLPMGAFAWREGLGPLPPGSHGSTFGGNPLCCAASRAALGILRDEGLDARAARLGEAAIASLKSIESRLVKEVRGKGLMIGIELRKRVTPILKELLDRGVWALPAGPRVLRLLPPLVIEEEDLARALSEVRSLLGSA